MACGHAEGGAVSGLGLDASASASDDGAEDVGAPPSDGSAKSEAGDAASEAALEAGVDAPAEAAAEAGHPVTTGFVRFANWAPDATSPGLDICLQATGATSWSGPLLGGGGVPFPMVSRYLAIAPGTYALRVVPASSTCADLPVAAAVGLPAIALGTHATFALVGDLTPINLDPPPKVVAFVDDSAAPGGGAALRLINATPAAAALDFGTGALASGSFSPLALDVEFGRPSLSAAPGLAIDANGYLLVTPSAGVQLSAHEVGATADLATGSDATWAAGHATTVVVINGDAVGPPPQLLLCRDDAPAQGAFAACATLAP
jgi:hypothetical protein